MNTNCLAGIRCPDCGYEDSFDIQGYATFRVTDDGSWTIGDHEWDDDSRIACGSCGYSRLVRHFRIENQEKAQ